MTRAGYTLVEILGAFFILTIILMLVTGIFIENGRQREAAIEKMRERLSAVGALEQLADDLEGAIFLTGAAEADPESNPWRFLAESPGEEGATILRFVTQNAPQASIAEHASGWVEVVYFLEEDGEGEWVLWRWRSARPPSEPDRDFPDSATPGSMRLAVGVAAFGVRLLDDEGEWLDEWDSSFLPPDQALPQAAEISLTLMRKAREGETEDGSLEVPGLLQKRRVAMPMRPLDVAALVELGQDGGLDEAECFTLAACLDEGDSSWYEALLDGDCEGDDELCELLADPGSVCWSEIESAWPQIAARAPEACGS
jgi:type II secretory pathway component PulJ